MPDGFDVSHVPGVVDVPPSIRRDWGNSTVVRVAEIVMRPLTLLVTGLFALAGMMVWGVWMIGVRTVRPLLYTLAGIVVTTFVLTIGGIAGYAYYGYQLASAKAATPASLADGSHVTSEVGSLPALPPQVRAPSQTPPLPPQTDPFGLKR